VTIVNAALVARMLPHPDQTCPPDTHGTHWPVYPTYWWCHDANL